MPQLTTGASYFSDIADSQRLIAVGCGRISFVFIVSDILIWIMPLDAGCGKPFFSHMTLRWAFPESMWRECDCLGLNCYTRKGSDRYGFKLNQVSTVPFAPKNLRRLAGV